MTRVSALLSLLLIGWLTAGTGAQERTLQIECPISEITLYPEGALSTHRTRLDLPRGGSEVTLVLNSELKEDTPLLFSSYRFTTLGCRLLEHSLRRVAKPATPEQIEGSQRALAEASLEVRAAEALVNESQSDLSTLEVMGRTMAEQVDLSDPDSATQLYEFLTTQRREISTELRRRETRREALREELAELEKRHLVLQSGTPQLQARLLVEADSEGPAELIASRFLEDAGWSQELSITRDSDGVTAEVSLLARIRNDTTRDWNEVDMTLSTVQTRDFQVLPPLDPAIIEVLEQDSPQAVVDDRSSIFQGTNLEAFHQLPRPVTLEHNQSKALLIERFQTACSLQYLARPLIDSSCHVQSRLRNETDQRISQAPVNLHQGGVMIGRTEIEQVPAGASFMVSWGLRPNIQVERELLERRSIRTGLLNGGRLTQLRFRITVRNLENEALELLLEDRLPTSSSGDIEIRVTEPSSPTMEVREDTGQLRWALELPAGGPDAEPTVVEWTVEVRHSADIKTTPIPE